MNVAWRIPVLTCKDVCDSATEYLEGPTTLMERLSLRMHLLICKECRRFVRQFSLTIGVAQDSDEQSPTDIEIDNLVEKLSKAQASDR